MDRKNIFTNALKDIRKNSSKKHKAPTSKLYSEQSDDDEIDFEKESRTLGKSREREHKSVRSVVIKGALSSNPYPESRPKIIKLAELKANPLKVLTKTDINGKMILRTKEIASEDYKPGKGALKLSNTKLSTKKALAESDSWKHDLYNEIPRHNFLVFIRNMPRVLTESRINDIFSEYGTILGVNVRIIFIF